MTPIKPFTIRLPGEQVQVGPGTVPTAGTSAASTSIADISKQFKKVSDLGIFKEPEEELKENGTKSPTASG